MKLVGIRSKVELLPSIAGSKPVALEAALASIRRDYSPLAPRVRRLATPLQGSIPGTKLHVYFPSFRGGTPTTSEMVGAIYLYLVQFALPRSRLIELEQKHKTLSSAEFMLQHASLIEEARSLFIKAHKATNRNGEAGELLLSIFTEWALAAPQILSKLSLKTNRAMPVHGADGVHVNFTDKDGKLNFYWGEAKLYGKIGTGITSAVKSISDSLLPAKIQRELELVQNNIDLSGLSKTARAALLKYLDPFDEKSNQRVNRVTCLIGFDCKSFANVSGPDHESSFAELVKTELMKVEPQLSASVHSAGLADTPIEIFLLPLPSVQELRDLFQTKIGWK